MSVQPYISFVVVARNDSYGGDFTHRVNVFIKNLLASCEKYVLPAELVIVEWNPPDDRPRLREAIQWPSKHLEYCRVRIIQVSRELHERFPNPQRRPLFEYIGKNVGVRRATGEYILATNPDIVFAGKLFEFFVAKRLLPDRFYRVDRYDVKSPVPLDVSLEECLEYCDANVLRVFNHKYCHENTLSNRFNPYRRLVAFVKYLRVTYGSFPFPVPNTTASGDFFLMHRDRWHDVKGYPELETQGASHHIDDLVVFLAMLDDLKQVNLKSPMRIYHQDHGRHEKSRPYSDAARLASRSFWDERKPMWQRLRQYSSLRFLQGKNPRMLDLREGCFLQTINGEMWGLGADKLLELNLHD
jgi:hypothetical protein